MRSSKLLAAVATSVITPLFYGGLRDHPDTLDLVTEWLQKLSESMKAISGLFADCHCDKTSVGVEKPSRFSARKDSSTSDVCVGCDLDSKPKWWLRRWNKTQWVLFFVCVVAALALLGYCIAKCQKRRREFNEREYQHFIVL